MELGRRQQNMDRSEKQNDSKDPSIVC